MATSLERAEDEIVRFFEDTGQRVFNLRELELLYSDQRWRWQIAAKFGLDEFLEFLSQRGHLREIELSSETYKGFRRFIWKDASPFEVAQALRSRSYLSHGTAVFLHGLTDQLPEVIYSNQEQTPKRPPRSPLTQERIDAAFSRAQRRAKYLLEGQGMRVLLLSGKYTDRLEVGPMKGPSGETLQVTKLERTLIDVVVRPSYAGGVFQILDAYRAAKDRISVGLLLATLQKLEYVYPYHQAIGFFMEKAGFAERLLARVEGLGFPFDFYLAHGIQNPVRVPRWQLSVPEGL